MDTPKLYFPSNGTEGDYFTDKWCANCRKATSLRSREGKTYCPILTKSLVEGFPIKQWIYKEGKATCTSFVDYRACKVKIKRPIKNQLTIEL